jgi:hypothetical protein
MTPANPNRSLSSNTMWSFHGNVGSPLLVDLDKSFTASRIGTMPSIAFFFRIIILK